MSSSSNVGSLSNGHTAAVNALALSDDGRLLASGGDDGLVCLWDADQRGGLRARLSCGGGGGSGDGAGGAVSALAFGSSPTGAAGQQAALAHSSYRLYAAQGCHLVAWDTRAMRPNQPLLLIRATEDDELNSLALLSGEDTFAAPHATPTASSAFGPPGRRLATVDDAGCVRIFDADTGRQLRRLRKHDSIASAVLFRPGRHWQVVSGGLDCRLVVTDWHGRRGNALGIFDIAEILDADACGPPSDAPPLVHCLAATPDGAFIAAGLENGSVELFNAAGRHLRHAESLYGHAAGVSALLCLPPVGRLLLSGGNDADCFLWNLDSDWTGGSFAHTDKVNALCGLSPERVYLADSGPAVHCCDLNVAQLARDRRRSHRPHRPRRGHRAAAAAQLPGAPPPPLAGSDLLPLPAAASEDDEDDAFRGEEDVDDEVDEEEESEEEESDDDVAN